VTMDELADYISARRGNPRRVSRPNEPNSAPAQLAGVPELSSIYLIGIDAQRNTVYAVPCPPFSI